MRLPIIWTIYRKEITDSLRDRLTLLVVLVLPLLLYPMLIIGISRLVDTQVMEQESHASKIAVWGENSASLNNWLKRMNTIQLELWGGAPATVRRDFENGTLKPLTNAPVQTVSRGRGLKQRVAEMETEIEAENAVLKAARDIITHRDFDAVLVIWPGFNKALKEGALGRTTIYYDSVRLGSGTAQRRLWDELASFRREQLVQREREHNLSEGFTRAVDILARNVAPQMRRGGQFIGSILPFLLIVLSAVGALNAAIDLTAGEKDRGTMQTLLCAPVHPTEIVTGKFLAVWTISLVAAFANTSSLAATFSRMAAATGISTVPFTTHIWTFFMLLPVTFIITAVFLAVAALARDSKDAGNFLGPAMMLLMGPLGAGMTPGMELNMGTSFVPLLNITLLIKAFYVAEAKPELIFFTLLSSIIYAMLALLFAARVFGREQVLVGGKESIRALFKIERGKTITPTPTFVIAAYSFILVVTFYGSMWLEDMGIIPQMLIVQYGFFLLPVLGLAALMKFSPAQTFSLRLPDWRGLLAALLMGLSAWTIVGGLVIRLLPPPDSLVKALEKIVLLNDKDTPLVLVLLILGITPAICEELLFRGLIFSGFRKTGKWPAIAISAVLFAIAHASIYRLLPTLFLGCFMGYLVWRTGSIYCSMLFHAVNNGLMAMLVHYASDLDRLGVKQTTFVPCQWTLVGGIVLLLGLFILRFVPKPRPQVQPVNAL